MKQIEPNIEEMSFIDDICSQYNYDKDNPIIVRNLYSYYRAEKSSTFGRNDALLSESDVISFDHFPTAPMTVGCLIGYWKTPRPNREMPSGQVAKQAQTLRELGFVFRCEKKQDGAVKSNFTFKYNGEECREIVGFDPSIQAPDANWNKLNKDQKKLLRSVFDEDCLGLTCLPRDREIDHRTPEAARKKLGKPPTHLTLKSLRDGSFIEHFQVISKQVNNMKREACNKCLKGETIPLPLCVEPFGSAYRQSFEEDADFCKGCFWHNYLKPKNEMLCPNLVQARASQQQKVQNIISQL